MARSEYDHDDENGPYRRFERATEWPMLVLSILFIALLVIPEFWTVDEDFVSFAIWVLWVLFALEVVGLFLLAPSKRRMVREHWLDILIVAAPFLRPLRLARIATIARLGAVGSRMLSGVLTVANRKGLQVYGAFTIAVVVLGGIAMSALERDADGSNITSASEGLWWAITTTTTVGYGDRAPVTDNGRILATVLMLVGVGLVGVITSNVAAYLVGAERDREMEELRAQLDRIEALLVADRPPE